MLIVSRPLVLLSRNVTPVVGEDESRSSWARLANIAKESNTFIQLRVLTCVAMRDYHRRLAFARRCIGSCWNVRAHIRPWQPLSREESDLYVRRFLGLPDSGMVPSPVLVRPCCSVTTDAEDGETHTSLFPGLHLRQRGGLSQAH